MTRIGYLRARRKQEIEEIKDRLNVDKVFIDLTDEFGFCDNESLKAMLEQVDSSDKVVVRRLNDLADGVGQLCNILSTLKEKGTELIVLDPMQSGILSDRGYELLSFISNFIKEKESCYQSKQSKPGRPVKPYPSGFLDVYKEYRDGHFNGKEAAKRLAINYDKFRNLVKVFEFKA
ncbi:recombinase family protein [Brevibacillus borstelensis]|uniref:recombinase family protein n=1 Tax=Brevibacillus borstelensis TaxID=45462 RepID=UPI001D0A16E6|nr:recombinase family protein [Brevibacillus borstelensis]MCC0567348.1 recombinase family protein [Brevibacillus borstelensis]